MLLYNVQGNFSYLKSAFPTSFDQFPMFDLKAQGKAF